MKFLNINTTNYNKKNEDGVLPIYELNKSIEKGDNVFILIYMVGCGPCNDTRPEWAKIKNVLEEKHKDKNNYLVVDIDKDLMSKIPNLQDAPNSFPTMRYIKGKKYIPYEKERNIDSLIDWIEEEINQNGGTIKKKTKTKRKRKRRKTKRRR